MDKRERQLVEIQVIRAQAGDRDAFLRLVERYSPRLSYYVRRLVGDPHRAEDVLQSVWLAAWRSLGGLRHTEAFSVWLYRIAHNQAIQLLRDESRFTPLDEQEDIIAPDNHDVDIHEEDAELVRQGLDQLRPEHRTLITLRILENMSYKEIAAVTGSNPNTVHSRLNYAKRQLRNWIEEKRHESE